MPVGVASNFGSRIKLKAEVARMKHRLNPPSPRCLVCRRSAAALIQPNTSSAHGHEGRSSKNLKNLIEQDHRGVKLRIGPMLGFKWFRTAAITIAGIELLRHAHKGQFNPGRLRFTDRSAPAVWNAALAA
jgi:hypothetical protein